MTPGNATDVRYLVTRYPDPRLRASMAREADGIGRKAEALGNFHGAGTWYGLARQFRDSLRAVVR